MMTMRIKLNHKADILYVLGDCFYVGISITTEANAMIITILILLTVKML